MFGVDDLELGKAVFQAGQLLLELGRDEYPDLGRGGAQAEVSPSQAAEPEAMPASAPAASEPTSAPATSSHARAASIADSASIAVLDFAAKSGITQDVADALADLVANTVRGKGPYKVLGKSDLTAMVAYEKVKDRMGCDDTSCLAEIGGALGVDYILGGNVAKLGQVFLINLRLVSATRAEVVGGVSRSVKGDESALVTAIPEAVGELFGK